MKASIAIILVSLFCVSTWAGEIPLVLPEKRAPNSVGSSSAKKAKPKAKSKAGVKKSKKTKIVKAKFAKKTKSAKITKKKTSSPAKSSNRPVRRRTASTERAQVEAYFKKETLSPVRAGSSSPKVTLPPQAQVGIKHSVRDEQE